MVTKTRDNIINGGLWRETISPGVEISRPIVSENPVGTDVSPTQTPPTPAEVYQRFQEYHSLLRKGVSRWGKERKRLSETNIIANIARIKSIITKFNTTIPSEDLARKVEIDLKRRGCKSKTVYNNLVSIELWAEAYGTDLYLSKPKLVRCHTHDSLSTAECLALLAHGAVDKDTQEVNLRDQAILELLLCSGIRAKELINLDICDVNFKKRVVYILDKQGDDIRSPGIKNYEESEVMISPSCARAIKEYIQSRNCNEKDSEALFIGEKTYKERLTRRGLEKIIKRCSENAGVDNRRVYPHLFRHTCATMMHKSGIDPFRIQKQLRHKNIGQTLEYTVVSEKSVRDAVDSIDYGKMLTQGIY